VHKRQRPAAGGGPKESYGWDVFNADSIYKAYEKRINKIPKLVQGQAITSAVTVDEDKQARLDMMAGEVVETMEKRN